MPWKHPSSLANKKFKAQASAGKVKLTVFWDVIGSIMVHFQEKGQTVTSARYIDMLVNELKPAIRSKRRGLISKRVVLLHDNARPHTAAHTVVKLCALKYESLKHPPYSPDLASWDFDLFGPMKEHLRGQKFANDEVMETVQSWLKATPKSFFLEGIRKLVDRWTKCVAKQGDYVEK
jgi:transposase